MATRVGPVAATNHADAREQVLKTYRHLRLAMVVLAVVLAASVVAEALRSGVVLDSISAYYFSPARSVFVSTLVAIGVGLIALQGGSRLEDAVLKLAGMFGPGRRVRADRAGPPSRLPTIRDRAVPRQ